MISTQDQRVIDDAVSVWLDGGLSVLRVQLLKIFGKDITPGHWIYTGLVIGKRSTNIKRPLTTSFYERYN